MLHGLSTRSDGVFIASGQFDSEAAPLTDGRV